MVVDLRELRFGHTVQVPSIDVGRLSTRPLDLAGRFEVSDTLAESVESADVQGRGSLMGSLIRSGDLSGSRFGPFELSDVVFDGVDVSNASWQSVKARRVEVLRSRAVGLRLSLESASDVFLDGCRLDYASIRVGLARRPVVFSECTFREATIGGDLSNVIFLDCSFEGAEFEASKAQGCDLRSSDLLGARGLSSLRGATVDEGQVASIAYQLATEAGLIID